MILSSYIWVQSYSNPDCESASTSLYKWVSSFGSMEGLVTDRRPHFTSLLFRNLTEGKYIRHHFSTAYCPWAKSTLERLCKEALGTGKAVLPEWLLAPDKWPHIINCLQTIINQAPLKRVGRRRDEGTTSWLFPLEFSTRLRPTVFPVPPATLKEFNDCEGIEEERAWSIAEIVVLHDALCEM